MNNTALALTIGLAAITCSVHANAQGAAARSPSALPPPDSSGTADAPPALLATRSPTPDVATTTAGGDLGSKRDFFKVTAGVRVGWVSDSGLDPFATTDALAGVSLGVSRSLWRAPGDRLALAAGGAYDGGGRGSNARGLDAGLAWHRFTIPIEGRYHVLPMLYGFARLSPGAHFTTVRIKDPSASGNLGADGWAFATDLSVGASVLLGPHGARSRARIWLTPEVGYMATSALALALTPSDRDDPRVAAPTELGSLGMNGPFMRITADVSF